MKKITSKIIQISDIIQWHNKKELELSPKYQRNSVWNENAKSYLIDTIIRGLPIPPIFLRQKTDIITKSTNREIIDGQQRIRAIIEYISNESFSILPSHNKEYGGIKYSQLNDELKEALLDYDIIAEVVTEKDDYIVYDMFARLNSNNYVLNKQEIRNSKYWGEFKVKVYNLATKYRDFFYNYEILSDKDFTRMRDAELINSMLILLINGIESETPTFVDNFYKKYDKEFKNNIEVEEKLNFVMDIIKKIYSYLNGNLGCLNNKNYFFTLYSTLVNQIYGIKGISLQRNPIFSKENLNNNIYSLFKSCSNFLKEYDETVVNNNKTTNSKWNKFKENHSKRTTNKQERYYRIEFLNNYYL